MIKSIFIGTRLEALEALKRYTNIELVITKEDSWVFKKYNNYKIKIELVKKTNKVEIFDLLSKRTTGIVLSSGFPYILPDYVLDNGSVFINSHPALLPAYKGYNSIKDALKCGEEYLGVTVHYMIEEVDAGNIIYQDKVWVKDMSLQQIYDLIFGVVEPMVVTKALEAILQKHFQ